jgi:hypothetical protein
MWHAILLPRSTGDASMTDLVASNPWAIGSSSLTPSSPFPVGEKQTTPTPPASTSLGTASGVLAPTQRLALAAGPKLGWIDHGGGEREIRGVAAFTENFGPWSDDIYRFGPNPQGKLVGELGCTMTAFTNAAALGTWQNDPNARVGTPGDANTREPVWVQTMNRNSWNPLLQPRGEPKDSPAIKYNPAVSPRTIDSRGGRDLAAQILKEVKAGHPVVLGMGSNSNGFARHTVLVTGYIEGKRGWDALVVRDNWRDSDGNREGSQDVKTAYRTTAREAFGAYGGGQYTKIDMAVVAIPDGGPKKP